MCTDHYSKVFNSSECCHPAESFCPQIILHRFFTLVVCTRKRDLFELFWEAGKDKCFHKVEMVSRPSELISCLST